MMEQKNVDQLLADKNEITLSRDEVLSLVLGCFLSKNGVALENCGDTRLVDKVSNSTETTLGKLGIKRLVTDVPYGIFGGTRTVELLAK